MAVPNGNNAKGLDDPRNDHLMSANGKDDGGTTETERVWVNDDGLAIRSLLKIQSDSR